MTKEFEPPRTIADLDETISQNLEVITFDKNNHWSSKTFSHVENIKAFFSGTPANRIV